MENQNCRTIRIHRRKQKQEGSIMDWTSIVRNLLLMFGGVISGTGYVTSAEWEQIVGAALIVGVAVWKIIVAKQRKAALSEAGK